MESKKYIVAEAGWDYDGEPFVDTQMFNTHEEAKDEFIDRLMLELGYERSNDEDVAKFKKEYAAKINEGKYNDYTQRYLLAIEEV